MPHVGGVATRAKFGACRVKIPVHPRSVIGELERADPTSARAKLRDARRERKQAAKEKRKARKLKGNWF